MSELDTIHPIEDGAAYTVLLFKRTFDVFTDLTSQIKQDLSFATNHLTLIKQGESIKTNLKEQGNKISELFKIQVKFIGSKFYTAIVLLFISILITFLSQFFNN